jgi:hypothetical protein
MMTTPSRPLKKPLLSPGKTRPWYTYRWPWLLMVMPAVALIGSLATIWIAVKNHDGLVEDDYYKKGLEINQMIDRDNAAYDLHLTAQVFVSEDKHTLRVIFNQPLKGTLTLMLLHPTQAGKDQKLVLTQLGPQLFMALLPHPFTALAWEIQITHSSNHWRLRGRWDKQNSYLTLMPLPKLVSDGDRIKTTP